MQLKNGASLALFPDLKGPTNRSVTAWAEINKEYLTPKTLLIVDNLKGHYNEDFIGLMEQFQVTVKHLPPGSGKLLNPCDNSLHSIFRRFYLGKPKSPHTVKIQSIVDAYDEISTDSINHCFNSCGYFDSKETSSISKIVNNLISEGYRAAGEKEKEHSIWKEKYLAWKRDLRTTARNIPATTFLQNNSNLK